ncbi:porin [Poseidonocella pacifica]|uniref:Porin n=1 Tax=Poseidonocella pacifica TaxID=871651 RepID=A0A1I0YMM1_9RHOB|nr:porin [Poseidonocella pacifica]SFB13568.1 porin [Poseidonocella pacifica]
MKRILLTSTALVAFAGAAAADISWSGAAELGFNDDLEDGVYADIDIDLSASQELDNGVTATLTYGFELEDSDGPNDLDGDNYSTDDNVTLSLTSEMASMVVGDTTFAAENYWNGVTNMEEDNFSEADGEFVIRGEVMYNTITAGVSYIVHTDEVADGGNGTGELDQLSFGATGDFSGVSFSVAYQEEADEAYDADFNGDFYTTEVWGVSVGTTISGADVLFAYASEDDEDSIGVEATMPVGPVSVTAFYVAESRDEGTDDDVDEDGEDNYGLIVAYADGPFSVDAFFHGGGDEDAGIHLGYDVGNGLMLYAGYSDDDGQYVAGEYDLGGGASFLVSYAEDEDDEENDEIGPQEYYHGTTLALNLAF